MNFTDCNPESETLQSKPFTRRQFVQTVGAAASIASLPAGALAEGAKKNEKKKPKPEKLVAKLYRSLTEKQKKEICFDWDHKKDGDLYRLHIDANWHITKPVIKSKFFTSDQQDLIEATFFGLYNPDWHSRVKKQLRDDSGGGGYGTAHNIAIFGKPGTGKFEFVFTGRHITVRCDGDSNDHVCFGGPIFYGHAAKGFNEKPNHPGNVYWHQAVKANALYKMFDGKQRKLALVSEAPDEREIHFQEDQADVEGIPISDLSSDQKEHLQGVLQSLVEPYRTSDRDEVARCLKAQGGLDKCRISFFASDDVGDDKVWDIWRLEGPAFVWHFRGSPHVHTWVNVASDPSVKISTPSG